MIERRRRRSPRRPGIQRRSLGAVSQAWEGGLADVESAPPASVRGAAGESRGLLAALREEATASRVLLAAALVLGALLRLTHLNAIGFNSDEAVYAGQAAAIARDPVLVELFPVFRAHPLLFQWLLSWSFEVAAIGGFADYDLVGRVISAAVGVATILVVYRLGWLLFGAMVGGLSALLLALMPYHVLVSRQVILDGPMTLCSTLALLLLAKCGVARSTAWLPAAGALLGLTFLAKETGIVFLGSVFVFLALSPELRLRLRDIVLALLAMTAVMAIFPLSLLLAGGGGAATTQQYLIWQLLRRPNHGWSFYLETVPPELGLAVVAAALAGLLLRRRHGGWREKLLGAWIVVPVLFFQLWPVKGFQYLTPIAPACSLLAALALCRWPSHLPARSAWRPGLGLVLMTMVATVVSASLALASWSRVQDPTVGRFPGGSGGRYLAGSGGVPGGREAGLWIHEHVPEGATLMTIGPSMANIVRFYGHRRAYGLSVSSNPLHRNPSYRPIRNPDLELRRGSIQYLVWDPYSAARSRFFSDKLLDYSRRYQGRVVHSVPVPTSRQAADPGRALAIDIIEVRP